MTGEGAEEGHLAVMAEAEDKDVGHARDTDPLDGAAAQGSSCGPLRLVSAHLQPGPVQHGQADDRLVGVADVSEGKPHGTRREALAPYHAKEEHKD